MWKTEKKADVARLEAIAFALEKEARSAKLRAQRMREAIESQDARDRRRQIPSQMRKFLDQGMNLPQAAYVLSMQLELPEGAVMADWEDSERRHKKTQRWHRDREVMRLANSLTNGQIATHPNLKALNDGKPLHPQTISRIIQKRLRAARH